MDKRLDERRSRHGQTGTLAQDGCGPALSALVDDACGPGELAQACAAWRYDPEARARWHRFLLLGDVMRSDELAAGAVADERFLQALRLRLADEAVPLAPRRLPWRRLAGPLAMAAGFAAVASMVWVLRAAPEDTVGPTLASVDTGLRGNNSSLAVDAVVLVRDRTIDRYLEDRRQQSIRRVAQPDGTWLRQVDNRTVELK